MLFSLISLAIAEPMMYHISEGEAAPFDGRLLNHEAMAAFIAKSEFDLNQCQIANDLDITIRMADKDLKIEYLEAELETTVDKYNKLLDIKEEEIKYLSRHVNPKMNNWIFLGGFALGTATSIATYYATKI